MCVCVGKGVCMYVGRGNKELKDMLICCSFSKYRTAKRGEKRAKRMKLLCVSLYVRICKYEGMGEGRSLLPLDRARLVLFVDSGSHFSSSCFPPLFLLPLALLIDVAPFYFFPFFNPYNQQQAQTHTHKHTRTQQKTPTLNHTTTQNGR